MRANIHSSNLPILRLLPEFQCYSACQAICIEHQFGILLAVLPHDRVSFADHRAEANGAHLTWWRVFKVSRLLAVLIAAEFHSISCQCLSFGLALHLPFERQFCVILTQTS